ncbi:MAG: hypothetical protein FD170_3576 [Bacteroidetes bacterium]|nr:MAG: hypothetical protein FD170_3576 [Bacteroidota bacterium]
MILFTGTGALSAEFAKYYSCKIISARLLDDIQLAEAIESCNIIIHNAATLSAPNIETFVESNFLLTKRILDIAYKINSQIKFINISSMSILKTARSYLDTTEMSHYALSKFLAEIYCLNHPMKRLTNIRFSTIFYKDPLRDGLSKLAHDAFNKKKVAIYNNGENCRDFIPINIAVKYLYNLVNQEDYPRKVNIASGVSHSFRHFVDLILLQYPRTEVDDRILETNEILCNFSEDTIRTWGELYSGIDMEFLHYLKTIHEDTDL